MTKLNEFLALVRGLSVIDKNELAKLGLYIVDMNTVTRVKTTVQGGDTRTKFLYLSSSLDDNGLTLEGKDGVEWCLDNANKLLIIPYADDFVTRPPANTDEAGASI